MSVGRRCGTGEADVNTGSWANSSEKSSDEEESSSTVGGESKTEAISGEALSSRHNDNDLRPRLSAPGEDIAP